MDVKHEASRSHPCRKTDVKPQPEATTGFLEKDKFSIEEQYPHDKKAHHIKYMR